MRLDILNTGKLHGKIDEFVKNLEAGKIMATNNKPYNPAMLKTNLHCLKSIKKLMADKDFVNIDRTTSDQFVPWLMKRDYSTQTARKYVNVLKLLFGYLYKHGLMQNDVALQRRRPNDPVMDHVYLNQDEIKKPFTVFTPVDNEIYRIVFLIQS
jgi:site-specific recombinase XerD